MKSEMVLFNLRYAEPQLQGSAIIRIMRSTLTLSRNRQPRWLISFRGHDTGEVRRCDQ